MSYRFEHNFTKKELEILGEALEEYGGGKLLEEINESIRNTEKN